MDSDKDPLLRIVVGSMVFGYSLVFLGGVLLAIDEGEKVVPGQFAFIALLIIGGSWLLLRGNR